MKFLFASDVSFYDMPDYPGDAAAAEGMSQVKGFFDAADFSIVNLETVIGEREAYTPIFKCGPNLISGEEYLGYVSTLNPSVLGMANNHTGDLGEKAVGDTLALLHRKGYRTVGAGSNIEEAYQPFIAEKDGVKVGILAICENEFGGAKREKAGSAVYQLGRLQRAMDDLKAQGCKPVVYFHGGNEYNPFPSPGKKELYRHFVDMGAAAVVAMHTHCPQGYETYKGAPIVYSMGNFFFPHNSKKKGQLLPSWFYGYLTEIDFLQEETQLRVIPYTFDVNGVTLLKNAELEGFMRYLDHISQVIGDDLLLEAFFDNWCVIRGRNGNPTISFQESMIEVKDPNVAIARNKFTCEAHNEVWKNYYVICYEQRLQECTGLQEEIKRLQQVPLK